MYHSRPVYVGRSLSFVRWYWKLLTIHSYIGVPVDIGPQITSSDLLKSPLQTVLPKNESELEVEAAAEIIRLLQSSTRPVILIDGGECQVDLHHTNPTYQN